HGFDGERRDVAARPGGRGERATLAEGEDHAREAPVEQPLSTGSGPVEIAHGESGERFRFGLVWDDVIGQRRLRAVERLRAGWIEDAAEPVGPREPQRVVDGLEWDLELEDDAIGLAEDFGGGIDIGGKEAVVRAFDNEDSILAGAVDEDRGDAARDAGSDQD